MKPSAPSEDNKKIQIAQPKKKKKEGRNSIFADKQFPENPAPLNKDSMIKGYMLASNAGTNSMFRCLKKNLDIYKILGRCDNQMDQLMTLDDLFADI